MERAHAYIRIQELKDIINEANRRYYVDNAPVLSDFDFDMLLKELEALEQAFPEYASDDSPTKHVGSDLASGKASGRSADSRKEFEQHPHRFPMLSLGNTYDISEVQAFAERAEKGVGNSFTFSCELKFDGTAICLTYRDGVLFRALTRGDGTVGDDVTENVRQIANIPQRLTVPAGFAPTSGEKAPWPQEFEIRGEIYMPWEAFDRLNVEREKDGLHFTGTTVEVFIII